MNLDENPLDVDDEMIEDEDDSAVKLNTPKIDLIEANAKP